MKDLCNSGTQRNIFFQIWSFAVMWCLAAARGYLMRWLVLMRSPLFLLDPSCGAFVKFERGFHLLISFHVIDLVLDPETYLCLADSKTKSLYHHSPVCASREILEQNRVTCNNPKTQWSISK
ncbi:hypothetical protein AQUCO_04400039v1 [Aquilegia coerulea]|uniref:Uncharacterized protein n=1 Tax=Aquilegia coerulea TaxID=218851 RepID=A0A2G5CMP5_AQUCA|nr:hypothetical protein AQUCO_04400039v1 [Aquilegia coerulea]